MSATPVPEGKSAITFTEKEENVLRVVWSCLKAGPPEVDIAKLTKAAGFNTTKTAANTWGVIKKKLAQMTSQTAPGEDAGEGAIPATPKTPKAKATSKKRGKKTGSDGDDEETGIDGSESPKKKQRKTPVKKASKKAGSESVAADEEGEAEDAA